VYQAEREEIFREACALGNVRAVQQTLRTGGVAVNGQNRVNGWTALHWAAHRGNDQIVALLLAHGADASITTKDGRTPAQLAKADQVRRLLNETESAPEQPAADQASTAEETSLPFTPHYLAQPDLARVWASPEEM
ncbi:hypothetical protein THASP1DRAFT_3216, partial [Thamnocephalis sphaerospora]